jgi:hypothetical protein
MIYPRTYFQLILTLIISLGITCFPDQVDARSPKKSQPKQRSKQSTHGKSPQPALNELPPPEPVIPTQVRTLIEQVSALKPERLSSDYKQNNCRPFTKGLVLVSSGFIYCADRIYAFDTSDPQPFWVVTKRENGKQESIRSVTMIDYPSLNNYTIVTHELEADAGVERLYISKTPV